MIEDNNNNNIQKRTNPYLSEDTSNKRCENQTLNKFNYHDQHKTNSDNHSNQSKNTNPKQSQDKFIYGNYANYYKLRRSTTDPFDVRLSLLEKSMFENKKILDIGCNSGNVTIVIGKYCKPQHILGVDIDEQLINKANSLLKTVYSLQKQDEDDNGNAISGVEKIMEDINFRAHYFPKSMSSMFGYLPSAVPPTFKTNHFPFNISFKTGNWLEMDTIENQYDIILAFSITKWIQLHNGDEGIKLFFQKIYKSLNDGGILVLEPQNFATYGKRAKLSKEMKEILENIKLRPEDYHDFLLKEIGFSEFKSFGTTNADSKGFDRPLTLYFK
ncbi:unnamed protein product [Cunninghamella blakesleeana]